MIRAIDYFLEGYDLLNEYNALHVRLPTGAPPTRLGRDEGEWCKQAILSQPVGSSDVATAFATSAARYYAFLRCRHFLDFSTSQSELARLLNTDSPVLARLRSQVSHLVVDEVQDINPVQNELMTLLVGSHGYLTAVGDHRQAIFGWRGGLVELMGNLAKEVRSAKDGQLLELTHNFRSTPRIIELSNAWNRTIQPPDGMPSPDMIHGRLTRTDRDPSHVATVHFESVAEEAEWVAKTISTLVDVAAHEGAAHDAHPEGERGLTYSDIAVLMRSSTDARTFMTTLQDHGIPAVVRAGPDLFGQPEVLLLVGALALTAGIDQLLGGPDNKSMPSRVRSVLAVDPNPDDVIDAAAGVLRQQGLSIDRTMERRLKLSARLIAERLGGTAQPRDKTSPIRCRRLRDFLTTGTTLRRVFPQTLFHMLLEEIGIADWDTESGRGATVLFHLGQLSTMVLGMETPGWTQAGSYKYQIQTLLQWGTQNAATEEAPLLTTPDAVSITTIHSAKGLQFAAVFVSDVRSARFPSSRATRPPALPFEGLMAERIPATDLCDNPARDGERRLMYVALTRAERYLFVTSSKPSDYMGKPAAARRPATGLAALVAAVGGRSIANPLVTPSGVRPVPSHASRETRLVTSFSDLRYFLECPHDFYLRKVLGFAPTIDQAFGYGRGIHNLLREIHSQPKEWAALADDRAALESRLSGLVTQGLFYLRHTTGEPAERMRAKAVQVVADYVERYARELGHLTFEPERPFETLLPEAEVLISGAIDVVRLDDPPRVTIIDFKSGEPESDIKQSLDEDEMRLQVTMYGIAAKHELEYEPDRGLVRYIGEDGGELSVDLNTLALDSARIQLATTSTEIRDRRFHSGPRRGPRDPRHRTRCQECDFLGICGVSILPRSDRTSSGGRNQKPATSRDGSQSRGVRRTGTRY
jgi:DNA helicase-2/ATP-dependent DNA helicase PcrA